MRAMVLRAVGRPLILEERPDPSPGPGEIRVRVEACAVCRTDLHVVDGDLPDPKLPIVPGHEIVGVVDALGAGVHGFAPGDRVGVPGSVTHAGTVLTALPAARTCATRR